VRSARRREELGEFLRERRGRLAPATDEPRRTPGLRRAELADLAGVSLGYYTRLEQGRAPHPSDSVLDALIRALELTDDEAAYLRALAGDTQATYSQKASPSALRTMGFLSAPTAAVVLGQIGDVLAWNDAAAYLFPGRLPEPGERPERRPNNSRFVFGPAARQLYLDWDAAADDVVAHLRAAAVDLVEDPDYCALVDELLAESPEFAERWSRRDVKRHVSGEKLIKHPELGVQLVRHEVLAVLDVPDQYLVLYGLENSLPRDVEIAGTVSTY